MGRPTEEVRFSQSAREAQLTSFSVVASCGLLPRTTRPGPRLRTAFWSVAILPLRDTHRATTWAPQAGRPFISRGCGLKYSVPYVSGPPQARCHPEPAKDPRPKRSTRRGADLFFFKQKTAYEIGQ